MAILAMGGALSSCQQRPSVDIAPPAAAETNTFLVRGIVKEVKPDGRTVVIQHEAVSNYMEAMTMPFKAKEELAGVKAGDEVSFRLRVTPEESWIEQVTKTGKTQAVDSKPDSPPTDAVPIAVGRHPLLDYKFTNEFGRPVSFNDFKGQALAYTFFFTRCPIPEYCPRLSKNFEEASKKLTAMTDAPTNWHLLSVSFDTEFDTPAVLRAYARRYHYDSNHWSFLTGPSDKIAELARLSGVQYEREGGLFNHGFRTLIIDAAGILQMSYPIGGDIADALAADLLKAAAVTNVAKP